MFPEAGAEAARVCDAEAGAGVSDAHVAVVPEFEESYVSVTELNKPMLWLLPEPDLDRCR